MTPKEKLQNLLDSLYYLGSFKKKKLAIIVLVDEILSINNERMYQLTGVKEDFYKEVKEELEKL